MKKLSVGICVLVALMAAGMPGWGQDVSGKPLVLVPLGDLPVEAPLMFSTEAEVEARVSHEEVVTRQRLGFRIHQGRPERLSLELTGPGEVVAASGEGLRDWSVRTAADGRRFLDLRPEIPAEGPLPKTLEVAVETRHRGWQGEAGLVLPAPGDATGFSLSLAVEAGRGVDLRLVRAEGVSAVEGGESRKFLATGEAWVAFEVLAAGSGARGIDLVEATVTGGPAEDDASVLFRLRGRARAEAAGSRVALFEGSVAPIGDVSGDGWHVELVHRDGHAVCELVAERGGELLFAVDLAAPVETDGVWRAVDFRLAAGVAVPVALEELGGSVAFDADRPVVPRRVDGAWRGFLPVDGAVNFAWREATAASGPGALFFSGSEVSEVRVGGGLLRQSTALDLRVLQGELDAVTLALAGVGEVLSIDGEGVTGWSIRDEHEGRFIVVRLGEPVADSLALRVESQTTLGALPAAVEPLRISPVGAFRHGGWLRVVAEEAVRVEVRTAEGLVQLPAERFPGSKSDQDRRGDVYRHPAAERRYVIAAERVLPEIDVTEVTVHELGESDRRITADLELEIREAPVREFVVEIPADHAAAAVTGAAVADFAVGELSDGRRPLRVLFREAILGRHLITLELEKSEPAAAGEWALQRLDFPDARSRRGYIGAAAAAGFRLAPESIEGLAESPVGFFPKPLDGLQQTFRIREREWSATLAVEALGRSVQADVFHLHSLAPGSGRGSVVIHWLVVGAPANEWRVRVPEELENLDVAGERVGRDWRREGDLLIVPLTRPALGASTLLLTFEQPMGARGGTFSPGSVRPLEVQGERGYVQVVSPLHVNHTATLSGDEPPLPIEPGELPAEFRLLSEAPTLAAWQYASPDFGIAMEVEWFEVGATAGQVVDFLQVDGHVSRDGQWLAEARLFVKSRDSRPLRLRLPDGAALWEARVDGRPVTVRTDDTGMLVPLETSDPARAAEVMLRYGGASSGGGRVAVGAPAGDAPVVMAEISLRPDEGRVLVPRHAPEGGMDSQLPETGARWIARHAGWAAAMFVALAAAAWLSRRFRTTAVVLVTLAAAVAVALAVVAQRDATGTGDGSLTLSVSALPADEALVVEASNLPPWRAYTGWPVWLALGAGIALASWGAAKRRPLAVAAGVGILAAGVLAIRGGAPWFLVALALWLAAWCFPVWVAWLGKLRSARRLAPATALVALLLAAPPARAETLPAESAAHRWSLRDGRLTGTAEIVVRAEVGQRFLLLAPPAVLGRFVGDGLRVVKAPHAGGEAYFVEAEASGRLSGRAEFEMPAPDLAAGIAWPGGPAAVRRVDVSLDRANWEIRSDAAARIERQDPAPAGTSAATVWLQPVADAEISARPRPGEVSAEDARIFVEAAQLYLPGAGVVDGRHRFTVRPAQGRVTTLTLQVPAGVIVSEITDGPAGPWRFDPATGELRVPVEPAQDAPFSFLLETQRSAGNLPVDLALEPVRVTGAAGEVGTLAVAFRDDAQPVSSSPEGLSPTNPEDSLKALVPDDATLDQAFRYTAAAASLALRVAEVAPELRAEVAQLVSIGEDRLVVAADLSIEIARSGVFRIDLVLPSDLAVESVTGEALSHWTESGAGEARRLHLQLAGRTLGHTRFHIALSGPTSGESADWPVPRIAVIGAARVRGTLAVAPERGYQVRVASRDNATQIDPDTLRQAGGTVRPGALAFRLLGEDWKVALGIEKLDPWVAARVFHEATFHEGLVAETLDIVWRIENAGVKSLRLRIPGLDAADADTLRASGPSVADLVPVDGVAETWEVRFERSMVGEARARIAFRRRDAEPAVRPVEPLEVRQTSYFVAVRGGGRLEARAAALPSGWERIDPSQAKAELGGIPAAGLPAQLFRVADVEGPLPLTLERHGLAGARQVRIAAADLTTLLSPAGHALTGADLRVELVRKETLRLSLPERATVFAARVNGEPVPLVRDGAEWLFHVSPPPDAAHPAVVRVVFSAPAEAALVGPAFDAPMENITWRVLVPEGWELADAEGDLDLAGRRTAGSFDLSDYRELATTVRHSGAAQAVTLLDQAQGWLRENEPGKAGMALRQATRNHLLDEASNEDARVQLHQLMTREAVLGLNTRRQRLVVGGEGLAADAGNPQLERAARANPLLQGGGRTDVVDPDRLLEGNSADEIAALKDIAHRIVAQQLAAEPSPEALDLTLPERGTIFEFTRGVQLQDGRPMTLEIELRRTGRGWFVLSLLGCLAIGALVFRGASRR